MKTSHDLLCMRFQYCYEGKDVYGLGKNNMCEIEDERGIALCVNIIESSS